jgi:hypothetical protein
MKTTLFLLASAILSGPLVSAPSDAFPGDRHRAKLGQSAPAFESRLLTRKAEPKVSVPPKDGCTHACCAAAQDNNQHRH